MEVCHIKERQQQHEMANLRASSLETLLHLVGAGFGCTLVPALAMRGSWTTDSGVVAQPLALPDASRRVSLVFRHSYPRQQALHLLLGLDDVERGQRLLLVGGVDLGDGGQVWAAGVWAVVSGRQERAPSGHPESLAVGRSSAA